MRSAQNEKNQTNKQINKQTDRQTIVSKGGNTYAGTKTKKKKKEGGGGAAVRPGRLVRQSVHRSSWSLTVSANLRFDEMIDLPHEFAL